MKNKEVITTTATEIESKALAPELVERREEHLRKYEVDCRNIEGSAWVNIYEDLQRALR